ncbi:polyamine-transporting ATPase [Hypericibacter terrae]|uniref:Polyamine-transporting ATPase n=1 Tax=Hypericibacter terrae TaxID=2602015 RepID=A0A5J6MFW2_9PROT|nr:ABC transporter ATP-binding protein [Hypericibacter terrae]QEX16333.1 polyamine-transporting ATPase [Hypericibacter terrae]
MTRGAVVEFKNVSKHYGNVAAVAGCDLRVEAGEFFTLLGPSGSGKTTLLNMLAGFIEPGGGAILIDGVDVTSIPTEKRNIGMVFQNYSLFPHMNVAQNVAFPLKMRSADKATIRGRVDSALELVGLAALRDRMPNQLSGGQRQRVAIARAIVFEPKVLLMDEPLGALDLKLRERMQMEIRHYRDQIGCTVIYVTHDQGEALTLSDRIMIMNEGRPVQVGNPETIYDRPASRFAAEFIGETNILTLASKPGAGWAIEELGVPFPGPASAASGKGVLLSVRPEKIMRADAAGGGSGPAVRFEAIIAEIIFSGDIHRYTARCAGGKTVSFKEHRTGSGTALKPGDKVALAFQAEAAVPLQEA